MMNRVHTVLNILEKKTQILVLIIGWGFCLWAYYPALSSQTAFSPWFDTVVLTGPLFNQIEKQLSAGHLPLIDWTTFEALHYNPHLTVLYPFYLFPLLDFSTPELAIQSQDLIAVFHIFLLLCTTTYLGRAFGLSVFGAGFFATSVCLSLNTFAIAQFPTIVAALPWAFLACGALVQILVRGEYRLGAGLLTLSIVAISYANPGSYMFVPISMFATVLYAQNFFDKHQNRKLREFYFSSACLVFVGVLVLLLTLGSSLNLLTHLDEIVRWTRSGAVIGKATPHLAEILTERRSAKDVLGLIVPDTVQPALGHFFVGPITVILAFLTCSSVTRSTIWRVPVVVFLLCIFLYYFDFFGVSCLLGIWPGISHARHLSVLGTPFVLCACLLAGRSLDDLLFDQSNYSLQIICAILGMTSIGLLYVILSGSPTALINKFTFLALSILGVVIIGLLKFSTITLQLPVLVRFIAVLIVQSLVMTSSYHFNFSNTQSNFLQNQTWSSVSKILDRLKELDRYNGKLVFDPSLGDGVISNLHIGALASYKGFETFHFYASPRIAWKFITEGHQFPNYKFYSERGSKYVVAKTGFTNADLELFLEENGISILKYRKNGNLVDVICPTNDIKQLLSKASRKPGRLPDAPAELKALADFITSSPSNCSFVADSITVSENTNSVLFSTPANTVRLVIINLPPYEAWRLRAGGGVVPLYNLGDSQIITELNAKTPSQMVLTYEPRAYYIRLIVSAVAIIFTLFVLLFWKYIGNFLSNCFFKNKDKISSQLKFFRFKDSSIFL